MFLKKRVHLQVVSEEMAKSQKTKTKSLELNDFLNANLKSNDLKINKT